MTWSLNLLHGRLFSEDFGESVYGAESPEAVHASAKCVAADAAAAMGTPEDEALKRRLRVLEVRINIGYLIYHSTSTFTG